MTRKAFIELQTNPVLFMPPQTGITDSKTSARAYEFWLMFDGTAI